MSKQHYAIRQDFMGIEGTVCMKTTGVNILYLSRRGVTPGAAWAVAAL